MRLQDIKIRLRGLGRPEKAAILQGFFKTGPGQYGEGDLFLGITVPVLRKTIRDCGETSLPEALELLRSSYHEERLFSLLLLIERYNRGDKAFRKTIFTSYLNHIRYVNNWDLVDLSAPNIAGDYLLDKKRDRLYRLAESRDLWKKRVAIVATLRFIREGDFSDTLEISRILLEDDHDLIHKAVGWMLREVGKRDPLCEEKFLKTHYRVMPRTMLRYAIERFPESKRRAYLNGSVKTG